MKKLIVYARVSTELQRENTSLGTQKERCIAWCVANGYEVADVVEEVMSGKNFDDREQMTAVMESVFAGRADGIVVLKLDRLSRNVIDILTLAKQFQEADKVLSIVELGIDTSTSSGKMILTVLGALAEMEREVIRERCASGRAAKKARGERFGGGVPYGYVSDGTKLIEVEAEQAVITRMKALRDAGDALGVIAAKLNADGITTKRGSKWAAMSVSNTLSR